MVKQDRDKNTGIAQTQTVWFQGLPAYTYTDTGIGRGPPLRSRDSNELKTSGTD